MSYRSIIVIIVWYNLIIYIKISGIYISIKLESLIIYNYYMLFKFGRKSMLIKKNNGEFIYEALNLEILRLVLVF